jgi:glucuronate isomerase
VAAYNTYLQKLEQASNISITAYEDLLQALRKRHTYFAEAGCRLSDHGLEHIYAESYTEAEVSKYFSIIRAGHALSARQQAKLKSALLYELSLMDAEKGWTQQFHLGALRNNNTRMMQKLGADTGFDSIGDFAQARSMAAFFDRLDATNQLTQTIIYNLNPRDNYIVAAMLGNFNDGSRAAKMQMGSGWWFLDQKEGMQWQINALSNLGLLSHFVGMLTDSRSFLSYPRHEYFRRILCNIFGEDVEQGALPSDMALLGSTVEKICYYNAKHFFGF